jgi:cysteine synthase
MRAAGPLNLAVHLGHPTVPNNQGRRRSRSRAGSSAGGLPEQWTVPVAEPAAIAARGNGPSPGAAYAQGAWPQQPTQPALDAAPGSAIFCDQFETASNFAAHHATTGPEIWAQTGGRVDAFVMGAGTGGTLAGVATYLKQRHPGVLALLADPPGSCLFNRVIHGVAFAPQQAERSLRRHRYDTIVEGVGCDRLTANFRRGLDCIDGAHQVSDRETVEMSRYLLRNDGLFVGSSTAMQCVAAVRAARRLGPGHTVVTLLCDSGHRHLSRFWNAEFISAAGLTPTAAGRGLEFIA